MLILLMKRIGMKWMDDSSFLYWLKQKNIDESVSIIRCSQKNLTDLKGIERLKNLTHLDCYNNNLTSLWDIESLTNLIFIDCSHNKLTTQ